MKPMPKARGTLWLVTPPVVSLPDWEVQNCIKVSVLLFEYHLARSCIPLLSQLLSELVPLWSTTSIGTSQRSSGNFATVGRGMLGRLSSTPECWERVAIFL